MTVDTLNISRRLQAVGASQELAEEQAQILREVVEEHLVTKADLREMELRMRLYNGSMAAAIIAILAALNFFVS